MVVQILIVQISHAVVQNVLSQMTSSHPSSVGSTFLVVQIPDYTTNHKWRFDVLFRIVIELKR